MAQEQRITDQEMRQRMADLEKMDSIDVGGETEIDNDVVASVAGMAAREVEGVVSLGSSSIRTTMAERVGGRERRARGVAVEAGRREAILDIEVRVVYGYSIPDIVVKVRQNVARRVLELLGLVSKEININVTGIEFPERIPGRLE